RVQHLPTPRLATLAHTTGLPRAVDHQPATNTLIAGGPPNGAQSEWAGLWWLPDDPDEQVPGVLRYEPEDGLVLSLIGAFEDRMMSNPSPGVVAVHEGHRMW